MARTFLLVLALGAAACSKKDDPPVALAPAAGSLAVSQVAPATTSWGFAVDPASTTQIDMPGLKEHIKADTSAAKGNLQIVAGDLAQSRGTVMVDLKTLATHTFGDDQDATQTKHALTWLEVVVDGQTNEGMRWATFAIRSIDGLSATDLTKVPAVADAGGEVRTVSMTVHGDLLVHGHELQKDVPVAVAFRYPAGSAPDAMPTRVEVRTRTPLHVVLKEVDVQPRDTVGKLTAWTTQLVSKVAETADVSAALNATPAQ